MNRPKSSPSRGSDGRRGLKGDLGAPPGEWPPGCRHRSSIHYGSHDAYPAAKEPKRLQAVSLPLLLQAHILSPPPHDTTVYRSGGIVLTPGNGPDGVISSHCSRLHCGSSPCTVASCSGLADGGWMALSLPRQPVGAHPPSLLDRTTRSGLC